MGRTGGGGTREQHARRRCDAVHGLVREAFGTALRTGLLLLGNRRLHDRSADSCWIRQSRFLGRSSSRSRANNPLIRRPWSSTSWYGCTHRSSPLLVVVAARRDASATSRKNWRWIVKKLWLRQELRRRRIARSAKIVAVQFELVDPTSSSTG